MPNRMIIAQLAIALLLIGYCVSLIYPAYTTTWQPIDARVIVSEQTSFKPNPDRTPHINYEFKYTYQVNEQWYESSNYFFKRNDLALAVCWYGVGDNIQALYNPNQPSQAAIQIQPSGFVWGLLILGLLMLVHVLFIGLANHNKSENQSLYLQWQLRSGKLVAAYILLGGLGYLIYVMIDLHREGCL